MLYHQLSACRSHPRHPDTASQHPTQGMLIPIHSSVVEGSTAAYRQLACIQKCCTTIYYQSIIRVCIVGELRYNVVFNKRRHDWITGKLYASKTADFQPALMQCLVERRMDANITFGQSTLDLVLPDLPANIGGQYRVKPAKADAIAKHRSRFGCQP